MSKSSVARVVKAVAPEAVEAPEATEKVVSLADLLRRTAATPAAAAPAARGTAEQKARAKYSAARKAAANIHTVLARVNVTLESQAEDDDDTFEATEAARLHLARLPQQLADEAARCGAIWIGTIPEAAAVEYLQELLADDATNAHGVAVASWRAKLDVRLEQSIASKARCGVS
jgi:hypothetical protein